jgi:hypothetical protein
MIVIEEPNSQTKGTLNIHAIKSIIQSRTCPVHNLRPIVNVRAELADINCCCDFFKSRCKSEISNLLKEVKSAQMINSPKISEMI